MDKTNDQQIRCSKCRAETHTNRYYCRPCDAERVAAYRSTPKGRHATALAYKKWASRNPERVKELQKIQRLKNRSAAAERTRAWRLLNKDRVKQTRTIWVKANYEKVLLLNQKYRASKVTSNCVAFELSDIENYKSKICGVCSEPVVGKYHLDHIVPLSKGGSHTPDNLQLTHPVCNLKKHNKVLGVAYA